MVKKNVLQFTVQQSNYIFEKFTKSCVRSQKLSKLFCKYENTKLMLTKSRKQQFRPVAARTRQYAKSPIPQKLGIPENRYVKLKSGRIIMLYPT